MRSRRRSTSPSHELGLGYELAACRGELMTGDELVDHARHAVSELTGSLST